MIAPATYMQALEKIAQAKSILITATASADGDSIGAQLALYEIIQQLKLGTAYEMQIINEEACPKRYAFLPHAKLVTPLSAWKGRDTFDLGFVLDGGSERTGVVKPMFDQCGTKVLVDHHQYGSEDTYQIRLQDPKMSSTAELVYNLLEQSRAQLTRDIAANLYLAMIFDTGFFRFSLTTPRTMQIGANLIATGIDFPNIAALGMVETSVASKKLLATVLSRMQLAGKGKIAWASISLADIEQCRAGAYDHEGIIENLCYIEGVETAMLALELANQEVKISFRSRNVLDVGQIARSLGGGGHTRASGCTLAQTTLQAACKRVVDILQAKI